MRNLKCKAEKCESGGGGEALGEKCFERQMEKRA